jgi:hypothetical protein
VEYEMFILPENMSSLPVVYGVRVVQSLVFYQDGILLDKDGILLDKDGILLDKDGILLDKDGILMKTNKRYPWSSVKQVFCRG